jgi:hypothetical protein
VGLIHIYSIERREADQTLVPACVCVSVCVSVCMCVIGVLYVL